MYKTLLCIYIRKHEFIIDIDSRGITILHFNDYKPRYLKLINQIPNYMKDVSVEIFRDISKINIKKLDYIIHHKLDWYNVPYTNEYKRTLNYGILHNILLGDLS